MSKNACGSCLDIYLSGYERISCCMYYSSRYCCLEMDFIAVNLTKASSLTVASFGEKNYFILFHINVIVKVTLPVNFWDHSTLTSLQDVSYHVLLIIFNFQESHSSLYTMATARCQC